MNTIVEKILLTNTAGSILKTLIYFDVFEYPLGIDEILKYHNEKIENSIKLQHSINQLVDERLIYEFGGYYSLHNNRELVEKRINKNRIASEYMEKALQMTKVISSFPFVKMVSLSGSLSKNAADEDSDIDYFIITKPGRVWLTRFLLTLYKKTVLLNNSKYFCTNLIMSEDRLKFSDHSHYIATEIVSLLPLSGKRHYVEFMKQNSWVSMHFPNSKSREDEVVMDAKTKPKFSMLLEKLFDGRFGDFMDHTWQEITRKKWRNDHRDRLYVMQNPKDYIDIQPHIAKGHGGDQYPKIRKAYQQKLTEFEQKIGVRL